MTARGNAPWFSRAALVATALLGAILAGCGTKPTPTEDQIVGTWVSQGTDGWGAPGGTIVFAADGTFVARSVPEAMLAGTRESTAIDGDGTWTIDDGSFGNKAHYYDPGVAIIHSLETPRTFTTRLNFANSRSTLTLTFWNDYDVPERYIFTKL